jgi:hypothetical protein
MNRDGIIASCEGDVPGHDHGLFDPQMPWVHAFQANPNWIDPAKNQLTLAHCTLPLDMAESYQFDTHFESGIGVGIHGVMKKGDVTIVKVGSSLNEFYCEEGDDLGESIPQRPLPDPNRDPDGRPGDLLPQVELRQSPSGDLWPS